MSEPRHQLIDGQIQSDRESQDAREAGCSGMNNFRNQKKRRRDWPDDSHSDEDLFEPEPIRLYIRNAQTNNPQVSLNAEVIAGPVVPNQVLHLTGQNAEPKKAGRHEFKRI